MSTSQGAMRGRLRSNASSTRILSSNTYTKHTLERSLKPEAMELIRCRHLNVQTTHVKAIELVSFNEAENRLITKKVIGQELFHAVWNPTNLLGRLQGHQQIGWVPDGMKQFLTDYLFCDQAVFGFVKTDKFDGFDVGCLNIQVPAADELHCLWLQAAF